MPGSIRTRRGSWRVIVDMGRDPGNGHRRQITRTTRTKREAEQLLVQLLHDRDSGLERQSGRLTVARCQRCLDDYVSISVAPSRAAHYRDIVNERIVPALGAVELVNCAHPRYSLSTRGCCAMVELVAPEVCRQVCSPLPPRCARCSSPCRSLAADRAQPG